MTSKVVPLRRVTRLAYGESLADEFREEGRIPVYGSNGVAGWHNRANTKAPAILIGRKGSFGKIQYTETPSFAIDTTFFVDSTQTAANLRWLYYALQTIGLDALNEDVGVPGLSRERAYAQRIRLSTPLEQRAIASYLDAETARIDALIEKKRRMVGLLSEHLLGLARDLTQDTSLSLPLRRIVSQVRTGTTPPANELDRLRDGDVPWYSPGDVGEWLALADPSRTLSEDALREGWAPIFPADSTLIVGIGATAGRVAHLNQIASGNQQMTCLVADSEILPRYLSWQLYTRTEELRATAPYTTLPILNNDFLKSICVSVPSLVDQQAHVQRLDEVATSTVRLSAQLESQIALLHERRQALITALVLGKLDVPGAAA